MPTDPTPHSPRRHGRVDRANEVDQRTDGGDFWGDARAWDDLAPQRRPSFEPGSGNRLGRWWKSAATAGSTASRTHGTSGPDVAQQTVGWHDQDDHAVFDVDGWEHERADVEWDVEPASVRSSGGIDPLIARLGAVIVVITVTASAVMALTSGSDARGQLLAVSAAAPAGFTAESTLDESASAAELPTTSTATATNAAAATSEPSVTTPEASAVTGASAAGEDEPEAQGEAATLLVALEPEPSAPACASEYELAAGDYWIRLADASGVRLADLLAVNDASVDTVLVPGRSICLPAGASTPAPPTTVAPPSTTAPATTSHSNTTALSRSTPVAIAPIPTATVAPRPAAVPVSQAQAIIRDVWPDDLEERALEIAWRESNYQSNVNNWCCYGLFQIHWNAHRSWLSTIGVTSPAQLYDPLVNASAAYTLYQRSGGFGPWGG